MRETKPSVKIIDNKKVLMTPDEFAFYKEICEGYKLANFDGKELFQDHFEVNEDGVIIFVKPPHKKYSSMEVYTFLISIMVNQQLRIAQGQVNALITEGKSKLLSEIEELQSVKNKLLKEIEQVEQPKKKSSKKTSKNRQDNDRK